MALVDSSSLKAGGPNSSFVQNGRYLTSKLSAGFFFVSLCSSHLERGVMEKPSVSKMLHTSPGYVFDDEHDLLQLVGEVQT